MSLVLRDPSLVDVALCAMNLIDDDRRQWMAFTGETGYDPNKAALACWSAPGPKWAVCDETNMPLAVGGCSLLRPNVYESWFLSGNELWETYPDDVTRITKQVVRGMIDSGAHRVQTIVLEDRKRTRAWYDRVGLHYEGVLPYYGANGENAAVYAAYRGS